MKITATSLIGGFVLLLASATNSVAAPITINWVPTATDVGPNDFNNASMSFVGSGFMANALVSINDDGTPEAQSDALVHSHNANPVNWNMDLLLNGVWTTVLAGATSSTFFIADNGLTAGFATGLVEGVRFQSLPGQNQSFHSFGGASLTFNAVPEPGSLTLLGAGLAFVSQRIRRARGRSRTLQSA